MSYSVFLLANHCFIKILICKNFKDNYATIQELLQSYFPNEILGKAIKGKTPKSINFQTFIKCMMTKALGASAVANSVKKSYYVDYNPVIFTFNIRQAVRDEVSDKIPQNMSSHYF